MRRNLDLIVNKVGGFYEILLPEKLTNPRLFVTVAPYGENEEFLCDTNGNDLVVADPTPGKRPYFVMKSKEYADVTAGDRLVDLGAVENCRDMGGYRTLDGKTVKWGRFFRGAPFAGLCESDKLKCDSLGLKHILDYRNDVESGQAPDYVPENVEHHLLPAIRGSILKRNPEGSISKADLQGTIGLISEVKSREDAEIYYRQFTNIYSSLPFENPAYQKMFDLMDSEDMVPFYQHCSAGKDRTGVGCALLLLALGVDQSTVEGEYLLSRPYRQEANIRFLERHRDAITNEHALKLMMRMSSVEEHLIHTAFEAILGRYRTYENFLREEYGVTIERAEHWREIHLF